MKMITAIMFAALMSMSALATAAHPNPTFQSAPSQFHVDTDPKTGDLLFCWTTLPPFPLPIGNCMPLSMVLEQIEEGQFEIDRESI